MRLDQDLLGLGRATPTVQLDPLALFQILVVLEEVADALQPVAGHLGDVFDVGVAAEDKKKKWGYCPCLRKKN